MTSVHWDVPREVRSALEPHLERWWALVPTWCQEFTVRYDHENPSRMAARINYANRWATLVVTAGWLNDPDEERANSVRHELAHVMLEPVSAAVRRIISDTQEEGTPLYELCDSVFNSGTPRRRPSRTSPAASADS